MKLSNSFIIRAALKFFAETIVELESRDVNWTKRIKDMPIKRTHSLETKMKMSESQKVRAERERLEREQIEILLNENKEKENGNT